MIILLNLFSFKTLIIHNFIRFYANSPLIQAFGFSIEIAKFMPSVKNKVLMKYYPFRILLLLGTMMCIIISCKDSTDDKVKVLHNEVMEIHDLIMPRMSEIHELKGKLRASLSPGSDSTHVYSLLTQLNKADDAMMGWMSDFHVPQETSSFDKSKAFYQEEKTKILRVKSIMEVAIDSSSAFLVNHKSTQK